MERARRPPLWLFVIPPFLAFSLFMVYFLQIRHEPFARHLVANPLVYDMEARQIISGEPYGRAFLMSPLYPGFVALVYKVARPDHLLVPYAQGMLLAINILLLGLATRKLLGDIAALITSFVMAFYWSFYYFAGEMVPATLSVTFVLLATLLFLHREVRPRAVPLVGGTLLAAVLFIMRGLPGLKNPGGGEAHLAALLLAVVFLSGAAVLVSAVLANARLRKYANVTGSGLFLGTACLVWGAALLFALPLFLMLLMDKSRRPAGLGLFLLGLCIPLAASFSHNLAASGDRVLVTTSFGVNLFIGNNPASDGMDPFKLGENDSVRQEADRLRLTGAARSQYFTGRAYEYIRTDTAGWLELVRRKALLSLSRYEIDNNADISERRTAWSRLFLPRLHFGIIFPLALVGMAAALYKRGDGTLPAWGFLTFAAVCILFFVCERFRLPGIVFLLPLATAGADLLGRALAGRSRGAALAVLLVLVGAAVSNIDFLTVADYEFPSIIVNKAYVERLDGNNDRARQLSHLAISLEPGNSGAHFQLGAVEEAEGDMSAALSYYLEALERDPYYIASYRGARRILEGAGVSSSYLDRFVEMAMRGEDVKDEKQRIMGFVRERTP